MYLMKRAGIMGMTRAVLFLTLLAVAGGCGGTQRDEQTGAPVNARKGSPAASRQITGTVKHIDLEGGFYGIVADDGQKFDPANLPDAFRQDGLRIRARVEPLEGQVSVRMWGTLVRIIDIQRVQ
jgi:hypothetical protein